MEKGRSQVLVPVAWFHVCEGTHVPVRASHQVPFPGCWIATWTETTVPLVSVTVPVMAPSYCGQEPPAEL